MTTYTLLAPVSSTTALGATLLPGNAGAAFRVWAPNASAVQVQLAPSATDAVEALPLGQEGAYWSADIGGVAAGHRYRFAITNRGGDAYNPGGTTYHVDPCVRQALSADPSEPGIVVDPAAFAFSAPFRTPDFANFIIYQAHVGSFAGRGDGIAVSIDQGGGTARFDQFETKLDYIRSMNFNAVQFLPTGEYRGSEGEAYNPSNYYAPETLYGSADDLRHLIDACHRRGLAVFLDMVYNHMDDKDNLWQFDGNTGHRTDERDPGTGGGIYFSTVDTGFGRRPDHDSPDVQRFFIENAAMWFREYQVDGLRFDSAVNFSEGGLQTIVQRLVADFPDKFIYAEGSDPGYIFNQIGFRACWDMNSPDTFARIVSTGDIEGLRDLIGHDGYPTAYSAIKYLLGSHDQVFNQWHPDAQGGGSWDKPGGGGMRENRYFVERIGGPVTGRENWYARAQARLGWALNVAMPCTPMLFFGSECHHYGYWNPRDDAYGDHRFDWAIAGDALGQPMRDLVRDVNAVRWDHPALRADAPPLVVHVDASNRVLAFKRWDDHGDVLLIVVNLSDNQWPDPVYGVAAGGPGDHWLEVFNSQAPHYGGWADSGNYLADLQVDADGQLRMRLPQWSVLLFRQT
ncbi:MAG TPA: alpha-amylase family glycosyl hydrolase [Chloroflexota bacterium]|jgi:1,4-alpha-glucan branching enzyme|nr:alpha-amylase family glycosyl hydrolase [Chloroflexota bacterium]